ncbi:MAG: type-F conjugative transfer system pilin assembly protein TrbC [Legionella sp. 40-6]|nr:type-F conjugative transfer system pilin assembly protein TrbC [Legionella sp.]OJY48531.1 MAG: type-F conjugative transfer system pilin assembly protein TrbC [Legionella sp. 40-6]
MFKKTLMILAFALAQSAFSFTTSVFVSFSMPNDLLEAVFKDASNHEIPVYLKGLIEDDMRKTLSRIFEYSQKYPNLSVQIDPFAFEQYGIDRVPALVVAKGNQFDVLYGNVTIDDGLLWLKRKGDVR